MHLTSIPGVTIRWYQLERYRKENQRRPKEDQMKKNKEQLDMGTSSEMVNGRPAWRSLVTALYANQRKGTR